MGSGEAEPPSWLESLSECPKFQVCLSPRESFGDSFIRGHPNSSKVRLINYPGKHKFSMH